MSAEELRNIILLFLIPQTRTKAFVLSYDLQSTLLYELESRNNSSSIHILAITWTIVSIVNTIIIGLIVRTTDETDTAKDYEIAFADSVKDIKDIEIDQYHDRCRARKNATFIRNLAIDRLNISTINDVRHLTNFVNTAREYLIDNS